MNIKKIGITVLSLSILTSVGLVIGDKKVNGVRADDPEPIVLDLHQEIILDRFAARLNGAEREWEGVITSWINDPTENAGINYFNNLDPYEHEFKVEDLQQVKNFVYIEYLYLNFHYDVVELPNRETEPDSHEYVSSTDYIRGMLDHMMGMKDDLNYILSFDYKTQLDDTKAEDIETIKSLVVTAYNVYNSFNEMYFDFFNFSGDDLEPFIINDTQEVKHQIKLMSDYFIANPDYRVDTDFYTGKMALRIYRLVTYAVFDEASGFPKSVHPLIVDDIIINYNNYFDLINSFEDGHGSIFDINADIDQFIDLVFDMEAYSKGRGLQAIFYFMNVFGDLQEKSNADTKFSSFFLNNFGPICYKILDLIEAIRDEDVPNIAILGKEVMTDSHLEIVEFYSNCTFNLKEAGDSNANLLIETKSLLDDTIFKFKNDNIEPTDLIDNLLTITANLDSIKESLESSLETTENYQLKQYLKYVCSNFKEFKDSIYSDLVGIFEDDIYNFLSELNNQFDDVKAMELTSLDDLLEFRTAVYDIETSNSEFLVELAEKIFALEINEDDLLLSLLTDASVIDNFRDYADEIDEQFVSNLDKQINDEILTYNVLLNNIAQSYENDPSQASSYLSQIDSLIAGYGNLKKHIEDDINTKIDDDRFNYDISQIELAITGAEGLKEVIQDYYDGVLAQLAKQNEDLEAFLNRLFPLMTTFDELYDVEITSLDIYTQLLNGFADIGIGLDDLLTDIENYMHDDSYIDSDTYDALYTFTGTLYIEVHYESLAKLDKYVSDTRVILSNKLQAIKTELDVVNSKYALDKEHLRAYYDEVNGALSNLDALLIEANTYDDAFIYDICIEELIGDINVVYDDGEELLDNIKNAMADSEIARLVALSNSFNDDIEAMQNHKDNGLNYKGNIERCDKIVEEMNAAIQNIDDNIEILNHDTRLVSARTKLVNGIESINASKQAIQKEHTTMLVLVIACPILLVILVFLLLYFFGFKKRFLRKEANQ